MTTNDHVKNFDELMQAYNFVLSVDNWTTEDLVTLGHVVDAELQARYDEEQELLIEDPAFEKWLKAYEDQVNAG